MLRLAIIGMGDMGCGHARGFDRVEGCEIVATVDPDPTWSERRTIEWQRGSAPPHYADLTTMLREVQPQACVLVTPDDTHRALAEQVLAAGCDLFLEKPVATTLEDCDAIAAAAERAQAVLQIGLVYRYSNLYRTLAAEARKDGDQPLLMWCKELRQCFPQLPWFYQQARTGGSIVEKDCHHFDIFNWTIGSRPVRVFATGGQHVWTSGSTIDCTYCPDPPRVIEEIDTVDHALVTIDYENGARASLMLCMYLRPHNLMPEGLEIGAITRRGRQLAAYEDKRLGAGGPDEPWHELELDMVSDNEGIGHIGCQAQRREFIACVAERRRPFADIEVGRNSLLIALAAEQSIRDGSPIDLREITTR